MALLGSVGSKMSAFSASLYHSLETQDKSIFSRIVQKMQSIGNASACLLLDKLARNQQKYRQ